MRNDYFFFPTKGTSFSQMLPKLKPRHCAALILGFPMLVVSTMNAEPVLAGSLFIALIAMMFDQKLSLVVGWLNDRIKVWQVIVVVYVASIMLTGWINPVSAISVAEPLPSIQQHFTFSSPIAIIKLTIVVLNLMLMATLFFTFNLLKRLFVGKS